MSGFASRAPAWATIVAAGVAAGIALRIWVLTSPVGGLDADEAVWGLMARHVLDGELSVFFWAQNYGGTLEALATAVVFAATGSGTLALRAVPIVLFALAAVLVWRVGRRTVGEPAARLAAVLFWIWPAYLVWKSTRAHGFYGAVTALSLAVLLLALRLRERDSWLDAALLGLALGLGWWASPQVVLLAVPALAWLLWRRPSVLRTSWPALPAFLAGAAPWLAWNLAHGFDSLEPPFEPGEDSYPEHLRVFFAATWPAALGLRVPFTFDWLVGAPVSRALQLLALAALGWLIVRRRPLGMVEPLVVTALAYPLLQSISPFASLNDEPRYLVLLVPVMALLLGLALARTPVTAAAGLTAAAALSVAGIAALNRQEPPVPPVGGQRVPADLGPAIRVLDRHGVDRVLAPYAAAYRLTFETGERIVATPTGQTRYRPHQRLVLESPAPGYLFVAGSEDERRLAAGVRSAYARVLAGGWAVYVPVASMR
jgi:4-amino-4-deoxy-L-arabinose transferase-like glycosyltransferase